jgi:hypothetical protein
MTNGIVLDGALRITSRFILCQENGKRKPMRLKYSTTALLNEAE